uniref:(northern house mosquito) hypothetical protein n=1 Tax=Culex pipiens TaxID=7175 RepID=A0A8D8BL62_CULPI
MMAANVVMIQHFGGLQRESHMIRCSFVVKFFRRARAGLNNDEIIIKRLLIHILLNATVLTSIHAITRNRFTTTLHVLILLPTSPVVLKIIDQFRGRLHIQQTFKVLIHRLMLQLLLLLIVIPFQANNSVQTLRRRIAVERWQQILQLQLIDRHQVEFVNRFEVNRRRL